MTDPVSAGIVKSATGSGENIAGTANGVPLPLPLEMALKVMPIRRLGITIREPLRKRAVIVE